MDKQAGLQQVQHLVERFSLNRAQYVASDSTYGEPDLRADFLDPFLEAMGWDVCNRRGAPQHLREVVRDDTVEVEDNGAAFPKRPDYALRLGAERKLFIEAKKPSVRITDVQPPAFQLRRYGWNARLPVSVLTNFDKLVFYDCRYRPLPADLPHVARLKIYDHTEYIAKFDELWARLSRDAVYSGQFDTLVPVETRPQGSEPFDEYFLKQIEA